MVVTGGIAPVAVLIALAGIEIDIAFTKIVQVCRGICKSFFQFFQIRPVQLLWISSHGPGFRSRVVMGACKQDGIFGNMKDIGTSLAHFPDIPAVQSEQVKADQQDFVFSVIGTQAAGVQVVQLRNGFVVDVISRQK